MRSLSLRQSFAALLVLALAAAGVLTWNLKTTAENAGKAGGHEQDRRVLVAPVLRRPETLTISVPASVRGYVEAPIYAKIPGYLKEIYVDKGDLVRKGKVLAVLESPELDHQVANARADYNLKLVTDKRNRRLLRKRVITQQVADQSHARMLQARAILGQLLAMQAYEVIRAPFPGMVTARYVDPGALIPEATEPSTDTTPIVAMATLDRLRIYAEVSQRGAPFIRDGDPAVVTVAEYPGREFKGTVTRRSKALNLATRTMRVEVDMENPGRALLPGMYATARFVVSIPAGVPMVPDDAVVYRNGKVYVPVVRNRRIRLAEVTLGYDDGHKVEVLSGISDDDVVAINLGQGARDGEEIEPMFANAPSDQRTGSDAR